MAADKLLTEIERQEKYLAKLPNDFEFPLFNVRHAVESQRRSGYRNTAAASREIIDNAVEAGASRVDVVFDTDMESGRKAVSAIAFLDNGSGMLPKMIRYALTWGGGTHFDDHDFIGRFGFGLPNSSINQTRQVEVYSRVDGAPFMRGVLDISNPSAFGTQRIDEPVAAEPPAFVRRYMARNNLSLEHGSIVLWVRPDRLSYKRPGTLKEHLVEDFGITYRYMLRNGVTLPDGLELIVEGVEVGAVDPLFLAPGARYYVPEEHGGAQKIEEIPIAVRYWEDDETGERHLTRIEDTNDIQKATERGETVGAIQLTIARLPKGFAAEKSTNPDAVKRFEIRKSHRGMSFVRAGREIQTVDVFPRSQKDRSAGLGEWPLLQSYAYHWGIEVRFDPALDDVFGITNDKQAVRPIEDFWRVLAEEEVDTYARRENRYQGKERQKAPTKTAPEEPTPAEAAAQTADVATNERVDVPEHQKEKARKALDKNAEREAKKQGGGNPDEARRALEEQAKRRKYRVDYNDVPGGAFYEPEWIGSQGVVMVNRQHQFYQVLYGDLLRLPGAARAKEALDLVLIALARSELTMQDEEKAVLYATQRRSRWSPFLDYALAGLAAQMPREEEDDDEVVEIPADQDEGGVTAA